MTKHKPGRPKKHKSIRVDQRKDPKGYQKKYYHKRHKILKGHKLNGYLVDFSPPKTTPKPKKNEWSF